MKNNCQICGTETNIIRHKQFNVEYHYCATCDFISLDEKYIISPEKELEIYNNHNNSIEDPRYVKFFYNFLNVAVFDYANEGKQGFDFGSGPSPVLAQILERYHDYDMDIYDLYYAKEKVYKGKKYDLITSTEVLEHIRNPIDTFKLFFELLKDNGILSIMTIFHQNDAEHFKSWHYIRDKSHISFYTPRTFEHMAKLTGFKIIYTNNERYITFAKNI